MKTLSLILFTLVSFATYSQRKNHTFHMNDGTIEVHQNVKSKVNKTYFVITHEDGTKSKMHYCDFYRYEYDTKKCGICKDYVHEIKEMISFKGCKTLVPILVDGSCKLFATSYGLVGYGGGVNYYVIRENESVPTQIGITGIISKNYKKIALVYFNDCKEMELKIKKRFKKRSRKRLIEVVEYYNQKCLD